MDLTEFLLARIAEDEAVAREAVPSITRWSVGLERSPDRRSITAHLVVPDDSIDSVGIANDEVARTRWLTSAAHIARHDPARVLAECDAKRRIVEMARRFNAMPDDSGTDLVLDDVLRLLALPYADHPDFDPLWRP